eukprot:CAMPEP_0171076858 /NCGR_PEP_ID=MMETSP0766_2-20121228/13683_1 /TAXON_ID=439317 /ORGANISM="Gambierdiscus australes, Strain CAWD 149" /LENGTH=163 /DNA_ID=CAMNT_0011533873 /DNA_START=247 /DNA_END=738 /DNA_ORIENTATION=-
MLLTHQALLHFAPKETVRVIPSVLFCCKAAEGAQRGNGLTVHPLLFTRLSSRQELGYVAMHLRHVQWPRVLHWHGGHMQVTLQLDARSESLRADELRELHMAGKAMSTPVRVAEIVGQALPEDHVLSVLPGCTVLPASLLLQVQADRRRRSCQVEVRCQAEAA